MRWTLVVMKLLVLFLPPVAQQDSRLHWNLVGVSTSLPQATATSSTRGHPVHFRQTQERLLPKGVCRKGVSKCACACVCVAEGLPHKHKVVLHQRASLSGSTSLVQLHLLVEVGGAAGGLGPNVRIIMRSFSSRGLRGVSSVTTTSFLMGLCLSLREFLRHT